MIGAEDRRMPRGGEGGEQLLRPAGIRRHRSGGRNDFRRDQVRAGRQGVIETAGDTETDGAAAARIVQRPGHGGLGLAAAAATNGRPFAGARNTGLEGETDHYQDKRMKYDHFGHNGCDADSTF